MQEKKVYKGLKIIDGVLLDVKGIKIENDKWVFVDDDPQVYIQFNNPISNMRIICNLDRASFEEGTAAIYYKEKSGDAFFEKNTFKFPIRPEQKIIREISFQRPVKEIRFDPVNFCGTCKVEEIVIEKVEPINAVEESLAKIIWQRPAENKIIVLTHDLSLSGAPILAYHIAHAFRKRDFNVVVLAGKLEGRELRTRYKISGIPVIGLEGAEQNNFGYLSSTDSEGQNNLQKIDFVKKLFSMLRGQGYSTIIANTIVSGQYVNLLKDYNFKVISLIHEMKTTIVQYGFAEYGQNIADNSDYIVFPNETVKQDFVQLFPDIKGLSLIRAQGVYLTKVPETVGVAETEEYGIPKDAFIVMSSGTAELRKGVDLFVDAALMLGKERNGKEIHFLWTGSFLHTEIQWWLEDQIKRSGFYKNVHFVPFIKDASKYKKLLERADVFWAMSREDPFPSTVLEAMKYDVPVIGFKRTGGVEVMLSEKRGLLVDGFNLTSVVEFTEKLLNHPEQFGEMKVNAKKYVDNLDFDSYVEFLDYYRQKEYRIKPALDLSVWGRTMQYQNLHLPEKTFEEKNQVLNRIRKSILPRKINKNQIVLLDTAKGSNNVGNQIIMDYCAKICREVLPGREFCNIPTHVYDQRAEDIAQYFKILCGTNLIYKQMEKSRQWVLPDHIEGYNNICLLGVGMHQLGSDLPMSDYSRKLLRFILSSKCIHSVCDEETKKLLNEIGIKNVVNTGCPTMWKLTEEHCEKISQKKAKSVVTTVTDYIKDNDKDTCMLGILKKNYESVYIWPQGQKDYEYLKEIVDVSQYHIIPPSLKKLDEVFEMDEVDFIGTRLHAGIRSLNYGHRTLIVSIDNRIKAIADDTNLPIIERDGLADNLEKWIYSGTKTKIKLQEANINLWKMQFKN